MGAVKIDLRGVGGNLHHLMMVVLKVLRKWRRNTSKKTKELSITFIPTDRLTRELERNIEYLKLIFLLPIEVLFLLTCSLL
uniref:Uncharacterized protein n=1 Tax=Medicago truncatula TaxID=3880 RepID=I3SCY7_MEDTR|nr:unknown [Medicago truncatula]